MLKKTAHAPSYRLVELQQIL